MEKMLIANARILDPSCEPPVDFIGDILIEGDRIIKVGSNLAQTKIAQGAQHDASDFVQHRISGHPRSPA